MAIKSKCKEQGISELLPWYISKSLLESEMVKVEQHLTSCQACLEESNNIRLISEGLYSLTGGNNSKHVNSILLTKYSESRKELGKEVIQRIDDHLSSCHQCREELEILNKVNHSLDSSEVDPFFKGIVQNIWEFFSKPVLKPVYAYILVLALLYPAWLGLFNKDNRQGKIAEPFNISNLFVLERDDQRATGEHSNKIVLDRPSDLFALSFVLPVKNQEDNTYLAAIVNDENKVLWHDDHLTFIDQFGTVIIICPRKYFIKGDYSLTVTEKQIHTKEVINKYFFNFSLLTKD
jgi:hypothetical protein